jgi:hypothetical protein
MPLAIEGSLSFQRMEILSACLSAAKGFCDVWLSMPQSLYFSLSLVHFGQLTRALLVLVKLCVFSAADRDASQVTQTLQISRIMDEMIGRMEEVSSIFGREGSACPFVKSAQTMRLRKSWYEAQLAALNVGGDFRMEVNAINTENAVSGVQHDYWSEDFWGGFSGNWDMVQK